MTRPVRGLLFTALLLAACGSSTDADAPGRDAGAPAITLPPAWTATPSHTPSPAAPTATPSPSPEAGKPTPAMAFETPRPTVVLPPAQQVTAVPATPDLAGWQEVRSETASFWLPTSYAVADLGEFGDLMGLLLAAFGEGLVGAFDELIPTAEGMLPTVTPFSMEEVQAAFDIDFLLAADETAQASVILIGQPLLAPTTIEALMAEAVATASDPVEVLRYEVIEGGRYASARSTVQVRNAETGAVGYQLVYVFLHGPRAWALTYAAEAARFDSLLPIFERSARSFEAR